MERMKKDKKAERKEDRRKERERKKIKRKKGQRPMCCTSVWEAYDLPSLGTPCSSMVVVRAFFFGGAPSDDGWRFLSPEPVCTVPSSAAEV